MFYFICCIFHDKIKYDKINFFLAYVFQEPMITILFLKKKMKILCEIRLRSLSGSHFKSNISNNYECVC